MGIIDNIRKWLVNRQETKQIEREIKQIERDIAANTRNLEDEFSERLQSMLSELPALEYREKHGGTFDIPAELRDADDRGVINHSNFYVERLTSEEKQRLNKVRSASSIM